MDQQFIIVKWFKNKFPDDPSQADKFDFGAGFTIADIYNSSTARIGDGSTTAGDVAKVSSPGKISVTSSISDVPSISAWSDTEDDTDATKKPQTKAGLSFAVSVGLTRDDAYAYIAGNATVDAGKTLTVHAESLNQIDPSSLELWNLISPFLSSTNPATYTTADTASSNITNGETVDVLQGFTGNGNVGDRYEYVGGGTSITPSETDYTTSDWKDLGSPAEQEGQTFVTNL